MQLCRTFSTQLFFYEFLKTFRSILKKKSPVKGLMIGHKVPEDNEHWKKFLLLYFLDIVLAPVVSTDCVAYLKVLINEHHENFRVVYPTCSIILKMHYMVHYPECIER